MAKSIPGEFQLAELVGAAVKQAAAQHASADALISAGQWPTAFAVAALGFEELGKAHLCIATLGMPPEVRSAFTKDFVKTFTAHAGKAALAHFALALVAEDPPPAIGQLLAEAVAAAEQTNETKFRGIYVDVGDDGALRRPAEVAEADARWMVDALGRLLESMGSLASLDTDAAGFVDFLRQWRAGLDFTAIGAQIDAAPDAFIAEARAALRGEGPMPSLLQGGFSDLESAVAATDQQ